MAQQYKVLNKGNAGTATKVASNDWDLVVNAFLGQTSGIPAWVFRSVNKIGFADNIFWLETATGAKKINFRTNTNATDVNLWIPVLVDADNNFVIQEITNKFPVKQEFNAGIVLKEMTAPETPPLTFHHLFIDPATKHLSRKDPTGATIDYDNIVSSGGVPAFFPHLTFKLQGQDGLSLLTVRNPNITSNAEHVFGKIPYGFIFTDTADSNKVKWVNGSTGAVFFSDTNAALTIQNMFDNIGGGGGALVFRQGGFDDTTTGLTFALTATKQTEIIGQGGASSILYSGSGYLLDLTGSTSNQQYLVIKDIRFDATTKTTGRHGIRHRAIGPTQWYQNVYLKNFDDALVVENTNGMFIDNMKIHVGNTGIRTIAGVDTNANALYFKNLYVTGCVNEGIHLCSDNSFCSDVTIAGGGLENNGTHIKVSGRVNCLHIADFYMEGATAYDIDLFGQNSTNLIQNVELNSMRTTGQTNSLAHSYRLNWVKNVLIRNPIFYSYTTAGVLLNQNNEYNLQISNPLLTGGPTITPFLIDSLSSGLLIGSNRIVGQVTDKARRSTIVNISSTGLIEGDVVILSGDNTYATTTVADSVLPAVITYPNAGANKPGSICSGGVTKVNVDSATNLGDTLTTSSTAKKARVNNNAVDPKIIIGYALEAIGAAGLCMARIGW